jgi:hypothetical protein
VLIKKWQEINSNPYKAPRSLVLDTISIATDGFLDDFSYKGPFPSSLLWLDSSTFVNVDFPIAPPTVGVCTFDGVDKRGMPYNFLASQYSSGKADTLTSKPIHLNLPASDSIYLSFYYQPQGRGNAPESADSLIVEFKTKVRLFKMIHDTILVHDTITMHDTTEIINRRTYRDTTIWRHVWEHNGYPLPANDSSWKLVMIPITDTSYLRDGFQFRFTNWATLSGNGDQWSIDYVYLNKGRTMYDTVLNSPSFNDHIAFVYEPPSLLKTYSAMPWRHYDSTFMKDSLFLYVRNNNILVGPVNVDFHNSINGPGLAWNPGITSVDNVNPYNTSEIYYNEKVVLPLSIPSPLSGPSDFEYEAIINTVPDSWLPNDTIRHIQHFADYYAYDDGTAETAFGLGGVPDSYMAEQFTSTKPDTLRCFDIYFDPMWNDATQYTIDLKIWDDNSGLPNNELESVLEPSTSPVYATNQIGHDNFVRYYLQYPVYIPASTFYIGFLQHTSTFLNVGVDKTYDSSNKIFYNVTGPWYNSPYPGSLMMHPVFGPASDFTGVAEQTHHNGISVYPNPSSDIIYIDYTTDIRNDKITYSITDIYGRELLANKYTSHEMVDISTLTDGVYFIRILSGTSVVTQKFVKLK